MTPDIICSIIIMIIMGIGPNIQQGPVSRTYLRFVLKLQLKL